jgi:sulfoxide reductase catalytic subunit YedY
VLVGGECAKPGRLSLDDLLKGFTPEERIYRLRCVEGWSMVIPWLGVPLGPRAQALRADLQGEVRRLRDPGRSAQMPGIRYPILDWPYREGLRIDEAMHPLAFLATGLYGKALPQQNGAPLRLLVPWKYGFKGIKSIVRIEFVEKMPETAWHASQPEEYGSSPTSIRPSTIRAGARRPSAASPAPRASCSPNASRRARSTATAPRSRPCTRAWT